MRLAHDPADDAMHAFLVRYGDHPAYHRASLVQKVETIGLGTIVQKAAVLMPASLLTAVRAAEQQRWSPWGGRGLSVAAGSRGRMRGCGSWRNTIGSRR